MEQRAFRIQFADGHIEDVYVTASSAAMDYLHKHGMPSMSDPFAGPFLKQSRVKPDSPKKVDGVSIEAFKEAVKTGSASYATYYDIAEKEIAEEDIPTEMLRQTKVRLVRLQSILEEKRLNAAAQRTTVTQPFVAWDFGVDLACPPDHESPEVDPMQPFINTFQKFLIENGPPEVDPMEYTRKLFR